MQRLGDLFSIILNLVFVFATVGYVASSIGDWVSELLRWRAKTLLDSVKGLLDDPQFTGAARALYNNLLFNPLGDGKLRSEADLSNFSTLPTDVAPLVFGQAMIEILGFVDAASAELAQPAANVNVDSFVTRATRALQDKHDTLPLSDRLRDLALNLLLRKANEAKATPPGSAQITNLLVEMIKETGDWFSFSQVVARARFRTRIRPVTFAVGFGLAAALDLQPVPIGGSTLAGKLPYGAAVFEWLIVAASTLLGASFWFEILKKIAPGIVGAQSGAQPTAGLAGAAAAKQP
jgi:hypothetical protein